MKLNLALMAAAALSLTGCVTYDEGYRTTGRVGDADGTYRGDRTYDTSRTRVVEDRAGNVYRMYPDGTAVLIGRSASSPYPYGYGGYPTYPYGGGTYSTYPYGYGGYSNTPYGHSGYRTYPGRYAGPPRVYAPRPGHTPTRPTRPLNPPSQPSPQAVSPPPPMVMGPVPPPSFTPRTEAAASRAGRAPSSGRLRKQREMEATAP